MRCCGRHSGGGFEVALEVLDIFWGYFNTLVGLHGGDPVGPFFGGITFGVDKAMAFSAGLEVDAAALFEFLEVDIGPLLGSPILVEVGGVDGDVAGEEEGQHGASLLRW